MKAISVKAAVETVVVAVNGRVLDSALFLSRVEAAEYKRHVRRWAFEKGVRAEVWTQAAAGRAVRMTADSALTAA